MDLRSRTLPGRQPDCSERDDTSDDGREDNEKQSSSPTLLLDDTPDFAATSQTVRPSASIPYNNRERETTPFVRWQLPSRMPREVMNFDRTMEELMEQERFPAMENSTPRYPYHDEEHRSYQRDSSVDRPRSSASRQRSETLPRVNSERDRGAVGTAALQNRPSRPKTRQPPSRGDADGRTRGVDDQFDYNRLLPPEPRPRGRSGAHRPAMYFGEPRYDYRLQEQDINEPRPTLPMFSGKHGSNWDAFWVKFELMARRYGWSLQKQSEQLLFCLKDDAMDFAAGLSSEVREDLTFFSQALRERFSHSTPAETVRANLNNLRKTPKETIQEYASRVRTMMARAYPDIGNTDTFTQMTIHHLLQGLNDQSIAYEVLIKRPRTLTEAVDMVTWHECCKETTRKKAGLRQVTSCNTERLHQQECNDYDVRRINGKKFVTEERLIQFGRELKAAMEKIFKGESRDENQQEAMKERIPNSRSPYHRPIICFFCHKEGHILPNCPKRQKKQFENTQDESFDSTQSENMEGLSQPAVTQSHC